MPDKQQYLQLSDFEGLVNETLIFTLEGSDKHFEGVLTKAARIKSVGERPADTQGEPFVLDFKFPPGADIGQCVLNVETQQGVSLPSMFLVPRGGDEEGWYMDVVFN